MDRKSHASPRVRRRRRRAREPQNALIGQLCEALLVVTVVGSVLAIGTVYALTLLIISAIAIIGGSLAMSAFRRPPTPALVLAAFAVFSLLQAIPLPAAWVLRLSPVSAQVWLHCLDPFGEHTLSHFPLSLDRGASIAEGLKWFTYAAVYVMAARVRMQRSPHWLALLLFGTAVVVAFLTIWHGAANLHELYGFYQPTFAVGRWNLGPLLNSNNFAGYANLGLFAGIGLLLSRSGNLPRFPALCAIGVILIALLLSGSRAGLLSAFAGSAVIAVWLTRKRTARLSGVGIAQVAAPVMFAILIFIALTTARERQGFNLVDTERKVATWRWSLPMIRDHLWFGVGRGAFETAFPPYRLSLSTDWTSISAHAENFIVQWLAEWGVVVGSIAVIVIVGYVGWQWYAARGERLRFLMLTGLGVLLLQNLADLGLEIPAVMIAAVVILAASERSPRQSLATESSRLGPAIAAAALLATVWLAAVTWSRSPVEEERQAVSASYTEITQPSAEKHAAFKTELCAAMVRHPGEAYFPLLGALSAIKSKAESPLPWLGRALELGPTNGRVHLVLAEVLEAHHATTQAMLHWRMAGEYDSTLGGAIARDIANAAPTMDVLQQGIPRSANGPAVLAEACGRLKAVALKVDCFRYAINQSPRDEKLLNDFAETLLSAVRTQVTPCSGAQSSNCIAEVDRAAHSIAKLDSKSWHAKYLFAKTCEARGDFASAARTFATACPSGAEGQACALESVNAAIASRSEPDIVTAADKYVARSCAGSAECAAALDSLGRSLDAAEKGALAITYFSRAAEMEGTADRWLHVADRAIALQLTGIARTALDRADRSPDATPATRSIGMRLRGEAARVQPLPASSD